MNDALRRRGIYAIFALHSLASGGIFPRVPDIQTRLGLNEAELGFLLMSAPLAGIVSFFFASWLVERVGTRLVILACIIGMATALAGFGYAPRPVLAALALGAFGLAFSISNVAINVEADRIEASSDMKIMNMCHGLWSAGFLVAALLGAGSRAWPISPFAQFALTLPVVCVLALMVLLRFPQSPQRAHHGGEVKRPAIPWPSQSALAIVAFGVVGSVAQSANSNWSVIYMRDEFEASALVEAMSIPCFLVALTIGRMLGDRCIATFGRRRTAVGSVASGAAGFAIIAIAPSISIAMVGFALSGFGTAVMFPLMVSAAAKLGDKPASHNVASVTMAMALLMMSAPVVLGAVAEYIGIRFAFIAVLPLFLLSFFSVFAVIEPEAQPDLTE